jgi:MinD-like ATPase involved in chromosome partitioning or flagellar assembly
MSGPAGDPVSELRDKYRNVPADVANSGEPQLADDPPRPNSYVVEERSAAAAEWQPPAPAPQFPSWLPPQQPQPQQGGLPQQQGGSPPQQPQKLWPHPSPPQPTHPHAPQPHPPQPPRAGQVQVPQQATRMATGTWTPPARKANTPDETRSERLGGRVEGAQRGWRATVNRVLHVNLRKGGDEIEYDRRVAQIQRTLRESKVIGVLSGKGSSGKTAVASMIGSTMASKQRGAKVVAMSIDPLGNLSERVIALDESPPHSVMSLVAESDEELRRTSVVGTYLQTDRSGLRTLGSSICDGADFLTPDGLDRALTVMGEKFDFTILDFGLNIDSPTYHAGLRAADQLVLAAATTSDSIDELHQLIKTLRAFGGKYTELIPGAVVALSQTRPGKPNIDIATECDKIVNAYGTPVITIPFDAHISEGGPMGLHLMDEDTQVRYVWLASEVMSKLPAD